MEPLDSATSNVTLISGVYVSLWNPWIQLPTYTQVNQLICKGLVPSVSEHLQWLNPKWLQTSTCSETYCFEVESLSTTKCDNCVFSVSEKVVTRIILHPRPYISYYSMSYCQFSHLMLRAPYINTAEPCFMPHATCLMLLMS